MSRESTFFLMLMIVCVIVVAAVFLHSAEIDKGLMPRPPEIVYYSELTVAFIALIGVPLSFVWFLGSPIDEERKEHKRV